MTECNDEDVNVTWFVCLWWESAAIPRGIFMCQSKFVTAVSTVV